MQSTEPNYVEFTPGKLLELEACYAKAVAENQPVFDFEGTELLTDYAKYLIEYVRQQFGGVH